MSSGVYRYWGTGMMTLPDVFSLPRSAFNAFLFAPIGEESNGMVVSVVSALARLDLDPWQEAARLSGLPKDIAAAAMGRLIGRLPGGRWNQSDIGSMAARLVELLPGRRPGARRGRAKPGSREKAGLSTAVWLAFFLLGAVIFFSTMTGRNAPPDTAGSATFPSSFVSPPIAGR